MDYHLPIKRGHRQAGLAAHGFGYGIDLEGNPVLNFPAFCGAFLPLIDADKQVLLARDIFLGGDIENADGKC